MGKCLMASNQYICTLIPLHSIVFLNANLPKFDVLPVSIYVEIPTLNSELEFQLKMQDSLDDLRSMVMQSMQQKQMEIAKWDEEARYFLCSPLTEVPLLEQLTSNELTTNEVTELSDTSIPVMQYSMKSGSKLLIAGNFVLEKDTPKPCFRQKQVARPTTMNYYSCRECKKEFICEPCRKACHEGKIFA
ncbi:hypothetical protein CAPTEDRAFT_214224 [Capitella teleta]|uniref:Uncharacterized protein n=1 Tax=Capitella teleta TaxID=283909 RepID=R7U5G5_CAPTE|nr:hypothetical protein CAPTEDRAFT_214224 [Capitella teleta]|eukprot:ELU01351.1 hypothetical protein CAPTEDRAFT_214224 [Capitella teleta]